MFVLKFIVMAVLPFVLGRSDGPIYDESLSTWKYPLLMDTPARSNPVLDNFYVNRNVLQSIHVQLNDICSFLLGKNIKRMPDDGYGENRIPAEERSINLYKSFYLILTVMQDPELEELILKNFQKKCREGELVFKRSGDEKVVGKKIKFHSWGGKRTDEDSVKQNIVNRAPSFHSWGGRKRSDETLLEK